MYNKRAFLDVFLMTLTYAKIGFQQAQNKKLQLAVAYNTPHISDHPDRHKKW